MTAAAFGPAGDVIALATAGNHVAVLEAATLRHTPWSLANTARPPQRLLQMPGSVCGISFCPEPQVTPACLAVSQETKHLGEYNSSLDASSQATPHAQLFGVIL